MKKKKKIRLKKATRKKADSREIVSSICRRKIVYEDKIN